MADFKFTGDERTVFPSLAAADGSTLVVNPGDVVTLDADPQVKAKQAKADPAPVAEAPQTTPEAPVTPPPAA
jgi:hypothetical protein